MNCRNSIRFIHSLSSQYRGPHIFNFAETDEEKAARETREAEEAAAAEAAKTAEEEAAAKAAAEEEEDPLATPNPFEEGSAQHDAFEKQREKFKQKLAKETEAARKSAAGELSGKMDELLTTLSAVVKPKETPKPAAAEEDIEVTDADVKIVTSVLKKVGFDPAQAAQDRRRSEVNGALAQIRKKNPEIQFDDVELVKHANDTGLAASGLPIQRILELAFLDKHMDAIKGSAPKPAVEPKKEPKKEPVQISSTSTKTTPAPTDKPKTFKDWKDKILGKHGGK